MLLGVRDPPRSMLLAPTLLVGAGLLLQDAVPEHYSLPRCSCAGLLLLAYAALGTGTAPMLRWV